MDKQQKNSGMPGPTRNGWSKCPIIGRAASCACSTIKTPVISRPSPIPAVGCDEGNPVAVAIRDAAELLFLSENVMQINEEVTP